MVGRIIDVKVLDGHFGFANAAIIFSGNHRKAIKHHAQDRPKESEFLHPENPRLQMFQLPSDTTCKNHSNTPEPFFKELGFDLSFSEGNRTLEQRFRTVSTFLQLIKRAVVSLTN